MLLLHNIILIAGCILHQLNLLVHQFLALISFKLKINKKYYTFNRGFSYG